jgi:HTH-type transcriptional regulator, glycine betaine synthesis regulator
MNGYGATGNRRYSRHRCLTATTRLRFTGGAAVALQGQGCVRYLQNVLKQIERRREAAELSVLELVGEIIEFWGFRKILGQVWAALYLAGRPLSAPQLQHRLHASAGAISLALGDLKRWGVVTQTWQPGHRGILYLPETNVWKMVSRVVRERELNLLGSATERLEASAKALRALARGAQLEQKLELAGIAARVEKLHRLSEFALGVLKATIGLRRVEPAAILKVANLAARSESSLRLWDR